MGRHPEYIKSNSYIKENPIFPVVETSETIYTLNEYLSNFSRNRNLDNVITKWHQRQQYQNIKKTKNEWDIIITNFFNETEK